MQIQEHLETFTGFDHTSREFLLEDSPPDIPDQQISVVD